MGNFPLAMHLFTSGVMTIEQIFPFAFNSFRAMLSFWYVSDESMSSITFNILDSEMGWNSKLELEKSSEFNLRMSGWFLYCSTDLVTWSLVLVALVCNSLSISRQMLQIQNNRICKFRWLIFMIKWLASVCFSSCVRFSICFWWCFEWKKY